MKLFVEGGGDAQVLRTDCRKGFNELLRKLPELHGRLPRVVASGSRLSAYKDFCEAIRLKEPALLLIDSEELVNADCKDLPWKHLAQRQGDQWKQPDGAEDSHCHLMVVCMESWFLADPEALKDFFGAGFNDKKLPKKSRQIEGVSKKEVFDALAEATKDCKTKARYGKAEHSFKLLAVIDPNKLETASPWAKRLLDHLRAQAA